MHDGTLVLFDLPGLRVVECVEPDAGTRRLVIMQVAEEYCFSSRGAASFSRS